MNPSGDAPTAFEPVRARVLALDAGFTEAGLVALPYPETERDALRFSGWIDAGRAATMRYLERVAEDGRLIRARVETPFPWAHSAIVCFASYASPSEPLSTTTPDQDDWLTGRAGQSDRSSKESKHEGPAWIARYAWSSRIDSSGNRVASDYHRMLLKRLKTLESRLHEEFGAFESRAYVDTGPVVERSLAVAAGLGWTGKNTCLIHPKLGSFGFLAVLLTSLEARSMAGVKGFVSGHDFSRAENAPLFSAGALAPAPVSPHHDSSHLVPGGSRGLQAPQTEQGNVVPSGPDLFPVATLPHPDRCGSCTRCIEACPTHALDTPYQMDASRCIAYLTIEHKGPIDESLMPGIGRQVFGCDICQDVCPWNAKSRRTGPICVDPDLEPRPELINPALDWLASLDEQTFERRIQRLACPPHRIQRLAAKYRHRHGQQQTRTIHPAARSMGQRSRQWPPLRRALGARTPESARYGRLNSSALFRVTKYERASKYRRQVHLREYSERDTPFHRACALCARWFSTARARKKDRISG